MVTRTFHLNSAEVKYIFEAMCYYDLTQDNGFEGVDHYHKLYDLFYSIGEEV